MPLVADKVVVTCALTGVLASRDQCPWLPYTPEELGEESRRAYEAGAAVVHIHARDPDSGAQTWDTPVYQRIKDEVRKRSPIILNFSTGGFNMGLSDAAQKQQRISYLTLAAPEMAALNMGSMNYAKYSAKRKGFVFDMVFENSFSDILLAAERMRLGNVKPELECFDLGHIQNAQPLLAMGALKGPLQYSFILGVMGGVAPTVDSLTAMARSVTAADTWEVIGISKVQWKLVMAALVLGGNIRVGLEDNFYLDAAGTQMAKGNGPLVEKAVRLARDIGREPMTPDEARVALGIGASWAT